MSEKKDLTRAEEVRLRREKETTTRMKRAAKDATRPAPPVTTRNQKATAAPRRKPARNARRRFQVALPVPSDRNRTFSIPRPRLGMRSVSFLLVAIIGGAIYLVYTLPYFRVAQAQVTGNQMLSTQEINSVMGVAGQPVLRSSLQTWRLACGSTSLSWCPRM